MKHLRVIHSYPPPLFLSLPACPFHYPQVIRFLSHPVMTGFTSGAAFYIGFSQLKYIFGITTPHYEYNYHM